MPINAAEPLVKHIRKGLRNLKQLQESVAEFAKLQNKTNNNLIRLQAIFAPIFILFHQFKLLSER